MNKYRIAICYDFANYNGGGVGRTTFELAKTFVSLGHEVIIINKEGNKCIIPDIQTYKLGFIKKGPFIRSFYYSLRLPGVIDRLNVDLVITQCNAAPFFGKLSKPHFHIVYSFQLEEFKYSDLNIKYLPELPLLIIFEYFNIRNSDKVLSINEYLPQEIKRKYDVQSEVIKLGIDTTKFRPLKTKLKNKIPRIISVTSKNVKRKNLKLLIEICSQMNVELRLTNSPYKDLPNNIIDLGYLSDSNLISELQQADLFVLPSLQEGFGIATLEALACNIPVVVTKTGMYGEIIKYKAGEVVENSYSSLKQGIITALSKNYLNNPRDLAIQYSWEKCASLILRLLESINS